MARTNDSRYTELAIFPEDEAIPLTTLAALWGMDAIETETLTLRLGDLSLIKLDLNTIRSGCTT